MADNVAKAYWNRLNSTGYVPKAQQFADKAWSFSKDGVKRARCDKSQLYKELVKENVLDYLVKKAGLQQTMIRDIDWAFAGTFSRN
jgi:hypothetical protein